MSNPNVPSGWRRGCGIRAKTWVSHPFSMFTYYVFLMFEMGICVIKTIVYGYGKNGELANKNGISTLK